MGQLNKHTGFICEGHNKNLYVVANNESCHITKTDLGFVNQHALSWGAWV